MKKTLLTFASVILIISVQAFPMKGVPYLGGSLGFNSISNKNKVSGTSSDGVKETNWNFSPEFGYFLSDHFSVGISLDIAGMNRETPDSSSLKLKETEMRYGVTLNARKYFMMSETFHIFTGLDLNIAPGKSETELGTIKSESDIMGFGANLNLGIAWNVTEKILIFGKYGLLGYNTSTTKTGSAEATRNEFGLNVNTYGNPLNVGMYFLIK